MLAGAYCGLGAMSFASYEQYDSTYCNSGLVRRIFAILVYEYLRIFIKICTDIAKLLYAVTL